MPRLTLICSFALLALAGCGGGEFSGDQEIPSGYKRFSGAGASFAYPAAWQVKQSTDPDGAPFVEITPRDQTRTPFGLVQLSVTPQAGKRFDSLADQRRIVLREVNNGKIDQDEPVDIPGADKALRASGTTPPGKGRDPAPVKADSLDVLTPNGDMLVLTAASPQRGEPELDPTAVVESFRLDGGS